jgi:hypothetical protein
MNGVKITCKQAKNPRDIVQELYLEENADWHKNVHKNGGTVQKNIIDTLRCISIDEIVYRIDVDDELAAFFTRFTDGKSIVLNSFHIRKNYRKKWFLSLFWNFIDEYLGNDYYSGLCTKNTPAIKHLLSNGFEIINEITDNDKNYVILHRFFNN